MMEPGQIIQWVVIGIVITVFTYKEARGAWKRKNGNPGNYGERIASLETSMEGVEEDIKAIKDKLNLV